MRTIKEKATLKSDGNLSRFCHPRNCRLKTPRTERTINPNAAWAEEQHTVEKVESTYTIQGFDLNYAGVIIGPTGTGRRSGTRGGGGQAAVPAAPAATAPRR